MKDHTNIKYTGDLAGVVIDRPYGQFTLLKGTECQVPNQLADELKSQSQFEIVIAPTKKKAGDDDGNS